MATGDVVKTSRIAAAGLCASRARSGDRQRGCRPGVERDHGGGRRRPGLPHIMNRLAAITQLAVFEAVRVAAGDHPSHPGAVNRSPGVSADAAAIGAAHGVLRHYFPDRAVFLDAARARSLSTIPDGPAKVGGITIGESAAARTIAARDNDGSEPPESYLPTSSNPGEWQLTSVCPQRAASSFTGATCALRAPSRGPISPGPASRVDEQPVYPGLQRGQGRRWPRQHRTPPGSGGRRAAVCDARRRDALEPDCESARGGATGARWSQNARTFALLNMTRAMPGSP